MCFKKIRNFILCFGFMLGLYVEENMIEGNMIEENIFKDVFIFLEEKCV